MKKVAVIGAGGKMGYRVSNNLRNAPYQVSHVEVSEAGRERLRKELGITCIDADAALRDADVVVLAIPDNMIEKVTRNLTDKFKKGSTLIALDAAAPFAGHLPDRGTRIRLALGRSISFPLARRVAFPAALPRQLPLFIHQDARILLVKRPDRPGPFLRNLTQRVPRPRGRRLQHRCL